MRLVRVRQAASVSVLSDDSIFFFQAEDGIRDLTVTGVQTCALPILSLFASGKIAPRCREEAITEYLLFRQVAGSATLFEDRSEERRVGKECRSGWSADD